MSESDMPQQRQGGAHLSSFPLIPQDREPSDEMPDMEDTSVCNERKKKSSQLWLLISLPFLAFGLWATLAPRIQVYTVLVCKVLRPEYFNATDPAFAGGLSPRSVGSFQNVDAWGEESCATDPVVQAGVSKLLASVTITSGIFSCITTSWWGSFSDRHGRNYVLGISVVGIVLSHLNMIFVSVFASRLPGNYWFLLVGSLMEGLLGGVTAISAAIESYVVDCTESSSRSRMLSIASGLISAGTALGPTLGGLLIRASHQLLSVFYGAVVLLICFVILVMTVLPESLSQEQILANKIRHAARRLDGPVWARAFSFLAPLGIFVPVKIETGRGGGPERDWNLTLIAASYATAVMVLGPLDFVFQYTTYVFQWSGETISYWLSLLGITKSVFLSLILPVAIKWLKPKSPVRLPVDPSEATLLSSNEDEDDPDSLPALEAHASTFDLSLARFSLLICWGSFVIKGLATKPSVFTAAAVFGEFGAGFSPGLQSVAVEVYVQRERRIKGEGGSVPVEIGKLYGSLSVVQALCVQMLGPGLFALIFMSTVGSFPAAVFLFAVVAVTFSIFLLSLVQLPKASWNDSQGRD